MCLGKFGVVKEVWDEEGVPMGLIKTASSEETACLLIHPEVDPGTPVVFHAGYVVEVLDEESAAEMISPPSGYGEGGWT